MEQVGGMDKGMRILHIQYLDMSMNLLRAVKSYVIGPGFTSHPKGVLCIFIAHYYPSSRPGLNP
jgi:hypothetical protein